MSLTIKSDGNNNSKGYGDGYGVGYGDASNGYVRSNTPNYSQNSVHIDDSYYKPKKRGGLEHGKIVDISYYSCLAIYGIMALQILAIILIAATGVGAVALKVFSLLFTLAIWFDAGFNVFYGKKSFLLILFAIFTSSLYPILRSWVLDGSPDKTAIIMSVLTILSMIFLAASIL